jgi:tripartite-type tricarboxylate transporter receptor subunit TctC
MKTVEIAIIVVLSLFGPAAWGADDFPAKPIQIICPFPPGGPVDLNARFIAEKMSEILGQQVILVNKPGGGTSLGWSYVASSKPDGYTLFTYPVTLLVNLPYEMPTLNLKMSDFIPVGRTVNHNFILLANKDFPANNLKEFIGHAKKNPGKISFGGSTYGSIQHIIGELIKLSYEVDLQFIPFNGENPAITAVLGNHLQVGIFTIFQSSHVKANSVKGLAVFAPKRDPFLPGLPSAQEQGFPDLAFSTGHNLLLAPAKTPLPIIARLESALEKSMQDEKVREKMKKIELSVDYLSSRETQAFIEKEVKQWVPVVKKANIVVK